MPVIKGIVARVFMNKSRGMRTVLCLEGKALEIGNQLGGLGVRSISRSGICYPTRR